MGAGMTHVPLGATHPGGSHPPRPGASLPLLARNAEDLLWLARYVERVENLARILDVTQTFAHDERDGSHWRAVLAINADQDRFFASHREANGETVAQFYLLDRDNPTSIPASLQQARENARTLRALISNEMWWQLNVFHAQVRALTKADVAPEHLSRICGELKEGCQTHTGITEGTFYRDQGRSFYAIGRYLERADQTTRLLDIGIRALHPLIEQGAEIELARWSVLLRAAAGYHAYRRVHPKGFSFSEVLDFLLLDEAFPRSLGLSLRQVHRHLRDLGERHGLPAATEALGCVEGLHAAVVEQCAKGKLEGLSGFLDWTQARIGDLHNHIAEAFFRT
jgi:uncharacterized alpha-E superfamily protein